MPGKSSIGFSGFEKLIFLVEISKFPKISKIAKEIEGGAPALRVIRAGIRLTVHRSLPIREQWLSRADSGSHKMETNGNFYRVNLSLHCLLDESAQDLFSRIY